MILALDTSTRTVGIALYDGVQVLSEATWTSQDFHTVELAPAIAQTLERCGIEINQVEAVAVALGPGSFTGLRIGLALAKGLALVRKMPLVGVPTLDFLAAAQPLRNLPLAAVLKVGRGRLAVGWYLVKDGAWSASSNIETLSPAELVQRITSPTIVCGEFTEDERRLLGRKRKTILLASPAQSLRRPGFLAESGWRRWQDGKTDDPAALAPIYIHYNDPIPG
jgi:tRNA threonylcarbamoyladenosine biosynthesis protein TsaB